MGRSRLTMGPVLFHWPAETKRDFWLRVADEAPVDVAYLGEVVCSKRTPFFDHYLGEIAERLERAGKKVIWSTLSQVVTKRDRQIVADLCAMEGAEVEANDASALYRLSGRPHRVGPHVNVYNEAALTFLASKGAGHFCLPAELPAETIAELARVAHRLDAGVEVQLFGRVSLALSARCYHARAHGRSKDNCLFVCENDPDGMELQTRSNTPFLSINGIQTLSHRMLNLSQEVASLQDMGVGFFRLSPHTRDMAAVASAYRKLLDGEADAEETDRTLEAIGVPQPTMNGFFHHQPGFAAIANKAARPAGS